MRGWFLGLVISLLALNQGFAQTKGLRLGTRFGVGEARINDAGISNQTGKLAISGGLSGTYQLINILGIGADVMFTSKGARSTGNTTIAGTVLSPARSYAYEDKYKLYYIEVPVLAKASLPLGKIHPKVFAGPSFNFNIHSQFDREYENAEVNEEQGISDEGVQGLNLLETSFLLGAGLDVELENENVVFLDVRNNSGINSIGRINNQDAKSRYLMISFGYLYKY